MWKTQALLKAIAAASPRECITEARMVEITGHDARSIENSCLKLRKYGLLSKTERGCHKLTAAGRAAYQAGTARLISGPKGKHIAARITRGTLRERAWTAMRLKGKFSVADLVMLCVEGGERAIESNLRKYLRALERVGYVRQLAVREQGSAPTSNGCVRYQLLVNTGPLAPVWRLSHAKVYDPNVEKSLVLANVAPGAAVARRQRRAGV